MARIPSTLLGCALLLPLGAQAQTVVINELVPNPVGTDADGEWIELYNYGGQDVDLSDWSIRTATSSAFTNRFTFPANTRIGAGEYLVVGGPNVVGRDFEDALGMGNDSSADGDAVVLENAAGAVIDTVIYSDDATHQNLAGFAEDDGLVPTFVAPYPGEGAALARLPNGIDSDSSAADFVVVTQTTLGSANQPPFMCTGNETQLGLVINEYYANPPGSDDSALEWVELRNNTAAPIDASGFAIAHGTSSYTNLGVLPGGSTVPAGGYLVVGGSALTDVDVVAQGSWTLGNGSNADAMQLRDANDCIVDTVVYGSDNSIDAWLDDSGAIATSLAPAPPDSASVGRRPDGVDTDASGNDFQVLQAPTPGGSNDQVLDCGGPGSGLVINEFLADPIGSDSEVKLEWIELYHSGSSTLDLDGWRIEGAGSDWATKFSFEPGATIAPGEFLLIGEENVVDADLTKASLSIGNASDTDGLRIVDCYGAPADTVLYGDGNPDGLADDAADPATEFATKPAEGASLQRREDGLDTDNNRLDFAVQTEPTPGAPNTVIACVPTTGSGVTINEVLPDPDGDDAEAGKEFVELTNTTGASVSLEGWGLQVGTSSSFATIVSFGADDVLEPGAFLVVGAPFVDPVDIVVEEMGLGNGTNGDAVRLVDCEQTVVDTVLYGEAGSDGYDPLPDDAGNLLGEGAETYGDPGSGQTLARVEDGVDTNTPDDWIVRIPTPGVSNEVEEGGGGDDPISGGCGCNRGAPGGDAPGDGDTSAEPGGGCATVPLPFGGLELWLIPLVALRRKR